MPDQSQVMPAATLQSGGSRPSGAEAAVAAARAGLDAAVALARSGDLQQARARCATVAFEAQPAIAVRPELLRATVHALLLSRAFKLLARLVLAISGRNVQVVMLTDHAGPIMPPQQGEVPEGAIYTLDPRWIDTMTPDDEAFSAWCEAVTGQGHWPAAAAHDLEMA